MDYPIHDHFEEWLAAILNNDQPVTGNAIDDGALVDDELVSK